MIQIEVWGTGKALTGFTEDAVLTSARKLFPHTKAQHIARFIAGKRFIITRVNSPEAAQKLIDGLAKSGIEADTAGPPPAADAALEEDTTLAADDEAHLLEEVDEGSEEAQIPEAPPPAAARKNWILIAGGAGAVVVLAIIAVFAMRHGETSREEDEQARIQATTSARLAAKFRAEAEAKKQAEQDAAAQAAAAAREAERVAKQEAAFGEIDAAFVDGNYPGTIALADKYEQMYGTDPRVTKLWQSAYFDLQERARRGDFAAILDAPIKGSPHFDALRDWALQAQERAKPVGGAEPLKPGASASASRPPQQ
ncbi:MAG TPA: hypothetical protein VFB36_17175 [Nevskiaceae bacterium]|nr:hypothetical protein [Nevskiaceae bacterium]